MIYICVHPSHYSFLTTFCYPLHCMYYTHTKGTSDATPLTPPFVVYLYYDCAFLQTRKDWSVFGPQHHSGDVSKPGEGRPQRYASEANASQILNCKQTADHKDVTPQHLQGQRWRQLASTTRSPLPLKSPTKLRHLKASDQQAKKQCTLLSPHQKMSSFLPWRFNLHPESRPYSSPPNTARACATGSLHLEVLVRQSDSVRRAGYTALTCTRVVLQVPLEDTLWYRCCSACASNPCPRTCKMDMS
jgi:hypothetical protein